MCEQLLKNISPYVDTQDFKFHTSNSNFLFLHSYFYFFLPVMKQALIIFVRKPLLGQVKTRLAANIGKDKTLALYIHLLHKTKEIADAVNADKYVYYTNETEPNDLWNGYHKRTQTNGDLGNKMASAFAQLFAEGYKKIAIIGSDCYDLTAALVNQAYQLLNTHNVVLGPANDGGYYLLALTQPTAELFANKNWSTATVLADTITTCNTLQLNYHLLPQLIDIDTLADLQQTTLYAKLQTIK